MSEQARVTFEDLSNKVDAYVQSSSDPKPGKVERWSFAIGLFAAGFGILAGQLIDGVAGVLVSSVALIVELLGLLLALVLMIKREWKTFAHAHRSFAQELDCDFTIFHEYVDWLKGFPDAEIARMLRYARDRKQMMSYRLGLFTGGLERLGLIPVLVALYLQFKDWTIGDWSALTRVNAVGGLLLWMLLLAYVGGWFLIRLRTRLDVYEALLAERMQVSADPG